jgi:hypothetical protein
LSDLTLVADYDVGGDTIEGVDYYDGYYWAVYHDLLQIKKFNSSFSLIATYNLSKPDQIPAQLFNGYYQGIFWYNSDIFANLHGANSPGEQYATGLDRYSWNGTGFTFVERLAPPTYGSHQGITRIGNTFYFADRTDNKIVKADYAGLGNGVPNRHQVIFYKDGAIVGSDVIPLLTITGNSKPTLIGKRDDGTSYFNGTIDEVRIYNRSLSAAEIYQRYIEGLNVLNRSTIVSAELAVGQNWTCAVTPNDLTSDGTTLNSSVLTIINAVPVVTLITPTNASYKTASFNFTYNVSDADGIADVSNCSLWKKNDTDAAFVLYNVTYSPAATNNVAYPVATDQLENILWYVNCTDSSNAQNSSAVWIVYVDSKYPIINFTRPADDNSTVQPRWNSSFALDVRVQNSDLRFVNLDIKNATALKHQNVSGELSGVS